MHKVVVGLGVFIVGITHAASAFAQGAPTGAPPPDAKALAAGPKGPLDAPEIGKKSADGTTVTVSAGGMQTTGNSRLLALTASGAFDTRFDSNGIGASILANYGQGAPPGSAVVATAQNVQGRLRYDRYVIERASLFLIGTGRHDRFQGLDFRLNVDPGFKYMLVADKAQSLWGEAGYDFQYDIRRDDSRVVLDDKDVPVLDANGNPKLLDKTATDHSARLFAGFRQAFNKEVTFSAGVEYLQSVVETRRWRLNVDAILAAKIAGGLAFGVGLTGRYDHDPLPGKKDLDTTVSGNLIYAFSDVQKKEEKTCPCPPEPPPPPPPPPPPGANVPPDGAPPPAGLQDAPPPPPASGAPSPPSPPTTAPAPSSPAPTSPPSTTF